MWPYAYNIAAAAAAAAAEEEGLERFAFVENTRVAIASAIRRGLGVDWRPDYLVDLLWTPFLRGGGGGGVGAVHGDGSGGGGAAGAAAPCLTLLAGTHAGEVCGLRVDEENLIKNYEASSSSTSTSTSSSSWAAAAGVTGGVTGGAMMDVDDITSAAAVPVSSSGAQAEAWRGFTVGGGGGGDLTAAGVGLARLTGGHTACVRCVCGGGGGGGVRALLTGGEDARLCVWMRGGVGGRELQVGGGGKALLGSGKVEKKSKKKKSKKKKEKKKKRQKDRNSPY